MILEASEVEGELQADVCIVGGGVAGLTLATELEPTGARIVVLEGGGLELEEATQDLYRGRHVGVRSNALHTSRLRVLGGTSGHWGGRCRPLDPIDFEARDWVPHSGWPFGRDELMPYYLRAYELLGIEDGARSEREWLEASPGADTRLDGPLLKNIVVRYSWPAVRFGDHFRARLEKSSSITVLLHANVVEIEADASAGRVEAVKVAALGGSTFRVRTGRTVLSTGAIENARLLLASDGVQRGGLGNGRDLVGRYFLQHPHVLESQLVCVAGGDQVLGRDGPGRDLGIATSFTSESLRTNRMLNYYFIMWNTRAVRREGFAATAQEALRQLRGIYGERDLEGDVVEYLEAMKQATGRDDGRTTTTTIAERPEQAPNPDSRVMLGEERDALGMRRTEVDWRLTDLDRYTLRRARELLAQEIGRLGLGRLRDWREGFDPTEPSPDGWLNGGLHHFGTTRMHDDPGQGVVDRHCRVHGIANLYVAGSSVFPTTGYANPTLTIIAMSMRLADELRRALSSG